MKIEDCFHVGKLTKTHGLKGGFIIWLDVDYPEDYEELDSIFLEINEELVPFFIEDIQIRGKKSIVKFEDIDSIEATAPYINANLYLPLDNLPELDNNQFYYHEVIGYSLINKETKSELGKIEAIYEGSGQDLITITINGKEVLIPIVDQIVKNVDHDAKTIEVLLPDGLIDLYTEE